MSYEEDNGYDYDEDNEYGLEGQRLIECRFCGAYGFVWEEAEDSKYILVHPRTGEVHNCNKKVDLDKLMEKEI